MFQFDIVNLENRMEIFSKCMSCHETGIACAPWGLSIKKENVAKPLLLKTSPASLYAHLIVCPTHFYEDLWWKIAFWGHEITSEVLPRLGNAALSRVPTF